MKNHFDLIHSKFVKVLYLIMLHPSNIPEKLYHFDIFHFCSIFIPINTLFLLNINEKFYQFDTFQFYITFISDKDEHTSNIDKKFSTFYRFQ